MGTVFFFKDGQLYGRGVADNKAAVILWISAIEMLQKHNIDIPLNIKACLHRYYHFVTQILMYFLMNTTETALKLYYYYSFVFHLYKMWRVCIEGEVVFSIVVALQRIP